jgi:glucose-6-phosphate isomerase
MNSSKPLSCSSQVAMHEYKVFTQGVIWGINSFDQWGVELGEELATTIVDELRSESSPALDHDASTATLIRRYRAGRERR